MNIKLHAKLAAYSKVTSVTDLPDPAKASDGSVLGVTSGSYVFFKDTDKSQIDLLFEESSSSTASSQSSMIDGLFN